MLTLTFYTKGDVKILDVTEKEYEKLAKLGIAKEFVYKNRKLVVEGEEYEIESVELTLKNQEKFMNLLEKEIIKTLEKQLPFIENPTIKEIREAFSYVETLVKLNKEFKNKENLYFSYD